VIGEKYTRLDQTDFAVEIAEIRAANPDSCMRSSRADSASRSCGSTIRPTCTAKFRWSFTPPVGSGKPESFSATPRSVSPSRAIGTATLDNPANKAFVAAWKAKYPDRPVTLYAAQGV